MPGHGPIRAPGRSLVPRGVCRGTPSRFGCRLGRGGTLRRARLLVDVLRALAWHGPGIGSDGRSWMTRVASPKSSTSAWCYQLGMQVDNEVKNRPAKSVVRTPKSEESYQRVGCPTSGSLGAASSAADRIVADNNRQTKPERNIRGALTHFRARKRQGIVSSTKRS